ncbi:long-chain fatty acid--CoA ligase [Nocardioides sp. KR10-350]|uniref:long-chain fatty acid--CoA ligase n=1 Tax=Nocardioides cheoyonin TaxID=3156615 RepID=UPI0032B47F85
MDGLMQDAPLTIDSILRRAERLFPTREIVTRTATGVERATYADLAGEVRRLAGALETLGVSPDGRVASFAWNTFRHLALYYAVPSTGRVLHTGNIRYFPDQLVYTFEHAEDEVVFVDRSLLGVLGPNLSQLTTLKHIVVMDDGAPTPLPDDPRIIDYEQLVGSAPEVDVYGRVTDENTAAAICYTSGTTGHPKGVVYSHRSTWLHAIAMLTNGALGLTDRDRTLPVVPMFHAMAWGLPYAAAMAGAAQILPGPDLSPAGLLDLIETEKVTVTSGVPTIWMGMLDLLPGRDLSLRLVMGGGSSIPRSLSEAWRAKAGIPITQGWGMTEMSPVGSLSTFRLEYDGADEETLADVRATAGWPPPGVELRIVDPTTREEQPWDGETTGELEARGPWIARQYYRTDEPGSSYSPDGWLRTGDVATIDPLGYMRIVDRTKDLVKSGGEWISSVEVENQIMAHPSIAEAAVIAVPHEKWGERPLAFAVVREGQSVTKEELLAFLTERLGKWQVPDDVVFIDEVPKTSVGKFSKKTLREQYADRPLPTS